MDAKTKHKRKAFYRRCAAGEKRAKQRLEEAAGEGVNIRPTRNLEPGMTGVMVSANNKEDRQALIEAYRLLNEAHERLNGKIDKEGEKEEQQDEEEEEDIESALRSELKADSTKKFIFNGVKTGVSNCAFVLNQSEKSSSAISCKYTCPSRIPTA